MMIYHRLAIEHRACLQDCRKNRAAVCWQKILVAFYEYAESNGWRRATIQFAGFKELIGPARRM